MMIESRVDELALVNAPDVERESNVKPTLTVTVANYQLNTNKDPDPRPMMMDSGATHGLTNDRARLKDIHTINFKVRGVAGVKSVTETGTYIGCKGGECPGVLLMESAPSDVLAVK